MLCFRKEFLDLAPLCSKLILLQIEQLYIWQLVEEAVKSCRKGQISHVLFHMWNPDLKNATGV
jgi:interferon regulatory factor 8